MNKWRSPLRYPGGKIKLAPSIQQVLVANPEIKHYIEPFAGGAGIAINLLLNGLVDHITLNDYDIAIYSFWTALIKYNEEFIKLFDNAPITIAEWKNQRTIFNSLEKKDKQSLKPFEIVKLGFATFFLNRTNFSGILRGATPVGGMKQTGKWKIDYEFNKDRLRPLIIKIGSESEHISIFNLNMINSLGALNEELQLKFSSNETLMFIDPPYVKQGKRLYLPIKTMDEHKKIAEQVRLLSSHWILTYDAVDELIDYYNFSSNRFLYELQYRVKKHRQATEFLAVSNNLEFDFSEVLHVIKTI